MSGRSETRATTVQESSSPVYAPGAQSCEAADASGGWVRRCPTRDYAILQKVTSAEPKSVKVNITTGTGVDIEWKDAHRSHYSFPFLRDACPCALCNDEREKAGREPGQSASPAPGTLPIFKPAVKPTSAEGVGKYAIKFQWNDGHDLGIYSWEVLRNICPCEECKVVRAE
jgi:DUF971 family protein